MDSEACLEMEQNPREQIISQIMQRAKIKGVSSWGIITVEMEYGSKKLQIDIGPNQEGTIGNFNVISMINKKQDGQRLEEETTFLYEAAKRFMQKYANEFKKILSYSLQTENKNMIAFAETKGAQIFGGWDQTLSMPNEPHTPKEAAEQRIFIKRFYPQKNQHE